MSAPAGSILDGKTALVTGAASGIGRAAAVALATAGAHVFAADLSDAGPTVVAIAAIAAADAGGAAEALTCDVSDEASVEALFDAIAATARGLDIVVNSAGVLMEGAVTETSAAEFDRQIGVNLRGSFLIARGAARALGPGGRLILIASELAHQGRAGASVYCASKAGVIGLTRSLARELAPDILVNAVAPGPTDTPMLAFDAMSADQAALEVANPLGRIGRAEEIADAILHLAGPGASFMTGQTICPSGGAVML